MTLQTYLDDHQISYHVLRHPVVYSAQELAAVEHVSGRSVIKPVVVRADGELIMCALPACYRVDVAELQQQLQVQNVEILDERALLAVLAQDSLDAAPPIGRMVGMPTLIDESLAHLDHVIFQSGNREEAVEMSMAQYRRIAQGEIAHFGRPC